MDVSVGPFKTQAEVGEFLATLSSDFGGTNMAFTVTKVEGMTQGELPPKSCT